MSANRNVAGPLDLPSSAVKKSNLLGTWLLAILGDHSKHLECWKNNYLCRLSDDMEVKYFSVSWMRHILDFQDFYEQNQALHLKHIQFKVNLMISLCVCPWLYMTSASLPPRWLHTLDFIFLLLLFYDSSWDWDPLRVGRRATLGTGTNVEIMKKVSLGRTPKQSRRLPSTFSLAQHFLEHWSDMRINVKRQGFILLLSFIYIKKI